MVRDYGKYETPGQLPNYDVVPLRSRTIGIAACQMNSNVWGVDSQNPKKGQRENLDKMLFMCDMARQRAGSARYGAPKVDLLVFPEFTFTGYNAEWTRDDWQRVAIEVPGEETEIVGKKAKELDAYIIFAAHTKDPKNWPDHYFNTSIIINPNGEVIQKKWKAYRCNGGVFEWATTAHDVLDRFIEMYGWDAVWPVARTDIGNLATYICSEGFAPETARAFAFKGAEILCRCIAGGGPENAYGIHRLKFRTNCADSLLYGIYANGMDGGSMIIDPFGRIMNEIVDNRECVIYDRIPIAEFRAEHARPYIRTEIYVPALAEVPGRTPPNMYSDYGVPYNSDEAFRLHEEHSRWWSPWTANR